MGLTPIFPFPARISVWGLAARYLGEVPPVPLRRLILVAALFFLASGLSAVLVPIYLYTLGGGSVDYVLGVLLVVFLTLGLTPLLLARVMGAGLPRLLPVGILAMGAFQVSLAYLRLPFLLGLGWGAGLALFWPPFNTYLFALTAGPRRTQMLTVLGVAIPGGAGVAGPFLGGLLADAFGFEAVFVLAALLFGGASYLAVRIPYPVPRPGPAPVDGAGGPSPGSRWRIPGFLRFAPVFVMAGATDSGWLLSPLYLYALTGGSLIYLGAATSVISSFSAVVSPFTGRWADRSPTLWRPAAIGYAVFVLWLLAYAQITALWEAVALGVAGVAGGLQGAFTRAFTEHLPRGALAQGAAEREFCLNMGRLLHLAVILVVVGSGGLSLAVFHRYFLVTAGLAATLPALIVLVRPGRTLPASGAAPGPA